MLSIQWLGLVLPFKNKMNRLIIILLCYVLFNSCDKEQAVQDQLSLAENSIRLQVNSECIPSQVQYKKTYSGNEIQEIINTSPWETSWVANSGDVIYFKVKDPTSGGQGGAGYPGGITKLVDMKIIYKDDIIGSAQKFFSHDNDGVYIYSTTVP